MFVCVLGIDPGLTRCGFGVILSHSDRRIEFRHAGIFSTSPQTKISDRLAEIHRDITELIEEVKPDVIAIERVLFQKNASTAMSVAQVSGLVHSIAASRNITVTEYSPNEVKSIITGDGRAEKQAIASMVTKLLNLSKTPQPADAADALAIAISHAFSLSNFSSETTSDSSDSAVYNGSNLHNAIADAIVKQTKGRNVKRIVPRAEFLEEHEKEFEREDQTRENQEREPQRRYRTKRRGLSR